ncbi:MAG: hypothetical protein K2X68_03530 [Novosphingobium sp.]|nr:hypothetical protein [Novosphingobium sp.]
MGRGTAALCREVKVTLRRARPHEQLSAPPGYKVIVAIADVPTGPEEQPWLVPARAAKQALNPRNRSAPRDLAAGIIPPGWQRA